MDACTAGCEAADGPCSGGAERTLLDLAEEAEEAGFTSGYDRSDGDVPSIAGHHQNEDRTGFYPIVRVLADLLERLASAAPEHARAVALAWEQSRFTLFRRLALFVLTRAAFPADQPGRCDSGAG